jgi:hypothetical protein
MGFITLGKFSTRITPTGEWREKSLKEFAKFACSRHSRSKTVIIRSKGSPDSVLTGSDDPVGADMLEEITRSLYLADLAICHERDNRLPLLAGG